MGVADAEAGGLGLLMASPRGGQICHQVLAPQNRDTAGAIDVGFTPQGWARGKPSAASCPPSHCLPFFYSAEAIVEGLGSGDW
jgi:hypothetical protein